MILETFLDGLLLALCGLSLLGRGCSRWPIQFCVS